MTTLIKQLSRYDCGLAAIAMAVGAQSMGDCWTSEDLAKVLPNPVDGKGGGICDYAPWLKTKGLESGRDYREFYVHEGTQQSMKNMLWKRRAILSVESLNTQGAGHAIYWDGEKLYDPSQQQTYTLLQSVIITRIILFAD